MYALRLLMVTEMYIMHKCVILLFVLGGSVLLGSAEDSGDLQAPAEGLVEQHPRLELRDEWEPSQDCDGGEQEQSHRYLVRASQVPDRAPETSFMDQRLTCLCNLQTRATKEMAMRQLQGRYSTCFCNPSSSITSSIFYAHHVSTKMERRLSAFVSYFTY